MSIKTFNQMCDLAQQKDIFYLTYGKITQHILHSVVVTAKNGVYNSHTDQKYSNSQTDSLTYIAIEMIQNVNKYRQDVEHGNHDLFLITTDDNITISTSNLSSKENKESISKSIDLLNSLDKKELRQYSREVMKQDSGNDNSAGLGLIEIARLSKHKIEYSFNQYAHDDNLFHFNMSVSL